mmetsp:Transcript_5630/g.6169  ORF Transcript_5630/g.6169 Transcript_5630/m.6169 type:complete len:211 (-) Transcript_5630:161-793(-)|eukprot:CAMPEP_0194150422 /NCGR_PEP_ID=MMETSP0152-20130528/43196_1 /TAXON_ID=1049557 /ORGANISM="Thalassiothrix antarctica, Strain L6-D1" /LENGTH=210 /DNA_ID=CAMNT_0038853373 /DNA_START=208 /DNA_END=840 /DNA_ORIENTATION=+
MIFPLIPHHQLFLLGIVTLSTGVTSFSTSSQHVLLNKRCYFPKTLVSPVAMSDWSDFQAMDDDDDDLYGSGSIDQTEYAVEDDSQEAKAEVGATLEAPTIEMDAEPLFLPVGSAIELSEDNVLQILAACRAEIGTMFGYTEENRGVGITGGVDFVEMDGPTVVLTLKGRFWHERKTVLARVRAYLLGRIPEIIDVVVEDEWQLSDEANRA